MNKEEWGQLWGLPHEAQLLYITIRRRRDYATGISGIKTSLCWNSLTEDLEVPSTPGRKSYRPTTNKLRHYASLLVKVGLLESLSDQSARKLIFNCLLAKKHKSEQKRFNISSTDDLNIPKNTTNPYIPTHTEHSENKVEHTKIEEVEHTSLYHSKNECMSDTFRDILFLEFKDLLRDKIFTEKELKNNIDDYLSFVAEKQTQPNKNGLRKLLVARARYSEKSKEKADAIDNLRKAETEKLNALAEREQQKADHIVSETIYRQHNPLRH